MKVANLIRVGIAARHRWQSMGNMASVVLIGKYQRDFTLVVWQEPQWARRLSEDTRPGFKPSRKDQEEHVRLERFQVCGEDIWMGYGPITDTLVIADPCDVSE